MPDLDGWLSSPRNPINWSPWKRWTTLTVLTLTNLVAAMTPAFEPALPMMMQDFHSDDQSLQSLTVSVYIIGYCIGPLIVAPMSEVYGRLWLLRAAYVIFLVSLLVCSFSSNLQLFIAFRAIMGFAGLVFVLLGPAIVPDLVVKERRGAVLGIMTTGVSLGPTLGPIVGGFVVQKTTWRWILWAFTIAFGVLSLLAMAFLRETYGPILKEREPPEDMLSPHDPASSIISTTPAIVAQPKKLMRNLTDIFKGPWTRPIRMLTHTPLVLIFSLYSALAMGYLQVAVATLGLMFQNVYGFSDQASGLAYLGMSTGFLISQLVIGRFSDAYVVKMEKKRGSKNPEDRMPPMAIGATILPAGLFVYGWGTHTHWIVPIIGSALIAIGIMATWLPVTLYFVDAFEKYAASALGARTIIQSICAALLPLAAEPLYDRLGYDWGNSLLGFIAIAFIPLGIVLVTHGKQIRERYPLPS